MKGKIEEIISDLKKELEWYVNQVNKCYKRTAVRIEELKEAERKGHVSFDTATIREQEIYEKEDEEIARLDCDMTYLINRVLERHGVEKVGDTWCNHDSCTPYSGIGIRHMYFYIDVCSFKLNGVKYVILATFVDSYVYGKRTFALQELEVTTDP